MKVDAYAQIFLWNYHVDRLLGGLQRMESLALCTKRERRAYEVRLEEIRASFNADFAEVVSARERDNETRLKRQRTAWEDRDRAGRS